MLYIRADNYYHAFFFCLEQSVLNLGLCTSGVGVRGEVSERGGSVVSIFGWCNTGDEIVPMFEGMIEGL